MARSARDLMRRRAERFPRLLSLEITSVCNADCIMCPHGTMGRTLKHMPMPLFEKILRDCQAGPPDKVNLFWFGDSFCNPAILDYLRMARRMLPGTRMCISTNAELMHPDRSDAILAEDLLDMINFDIDGVTKEAYEGIRRGVDFDTVMANTLHFLDRKKALGKRRPQTRATIINMTATQGEVEAFRAYWTGRTDKVEVREYNTWLGEMEDHNVGEAAVRSTEGSFTFPCRHPWDELVIGADGTAGLCCLDYDLTAPLGSLEKESLLEIWNGKVMDAYRRRMLALDHGSIGCCSNCNAHIYQDKSTWAKLWRAAPHKSAPGKQAAAEG